MSTLPRSFQEFPAPDNFPAIAPGAPPCSWVRMNWLKMKSDDLTLFLILSRRVGLIREKNNPLSLHLLLHLTLSFSCSPSLPLSIPLYLSYLSLTSLSQFFTPSPSISLTLSVPSSLPLLLYVSFSLSLFHLLSLTLSLSHALSLSQSFCLSLCIYLFCSLSLSDTCIFCIVYF